ncbi:MAG: hypothetical protein GXO35_04755 [Gammaproteobacteria bacterium]|nr:hypothetical protein [Gammaproteobacteria bacterium]
MQVGQNRIYFDNIERVTLYLCNYDKVQRKNLVRDVIYVSGQEAFNRLMHKLLTRPFHCWQVYRPRLTNPAQYKDVLIFGLLSNYTAGAWWASDLSNGQHAMYDGASEPNDGAFSTSGIRLPTQNVALSGYDKWASLAAAEPVIFFTEDGTMMSINHKKIIATTDVNYDRIKRAIRGEDELCNVNVLGFPSEPKWQKLQDKRMERVKAAYKSGEAEALLVDDPAIM